MHHLGMDVSKREIVFFPDRTGNHTVIPNDIQPIRQFLEEQAFVPGKTVIGCESTGDFHNQACLVALGMGYPVKVLNPLLTKQVINATVRKKKTDFSDAQVVSKLLADGHGTEVTRESFLKTKRTMIRTEQTLIACASDLKRYLKSLQEKAKVMEVGEPLKAVTRCIAVLEKEAKGLIEGALEGQNRQEEILDSIPGCGAKLAAIISEEAGDIKRFPSAVQFKAYAGLDPKVTQSGNNLHTGHMTKRGNALLRHALFLAANIARQWDPELKAFYEKKRSEGKSYRHAVCTVARKLCERIYAIISKNCLYEVRQPPC